MSSGFCTSTNLSKQGFFYWDSTNVQNQVISLYLDRDLNQIQTRYPICTRIHSYEELNGDLILSRAVTMNRSLQDDLFQLLLIHFYDPESSKTITINCFLGNIYQTMVSLETNENWHHIPQKMTLIFYELVIGLDRFTI
jgi:hypothetical protein